MAEMKCEGKSVDRKERSKKEVFLFFSPSDQLESVILNHKLLSKFIIIGQSVESLDGIEELKNLEELWIVECGLKQEVGLMQSEVVTHLKIKNYSKPI
jgi:hypothetical protein